jgi:hypothetical protein
MFDHPYVMEKLMELERPRLIHISSFQLPQRTRRPNRIASSVGRAMRRAGEGLEAWAGPSGGSQARDCPSPEARHY